ncbi:MAG: right-handed parallel beta-helix repeat-containing protein [bacterium]
MKNTIRNIFILVCSLFATNTYAVDGVLEINQTCATQLGCFSGDTPGYPVTIDGSAGVSYKLTSSLIIPTVDTNGIEITSPSISIDLNGFEIVGIACVGATSNCTPATGTGTGIYASSNYSNISISNGSVTGMGDSGIYLSGDACAISKVRSRWNRLEGIFFACPGSVINSTISDNGRNGIYTSSSAKVIGNVVSSNGQNGIQAGSGSTIANNTAYNNGGDGIQVLHGSTIANNTAYSNASDGILTYSGSTVTNNTAYSNDGDGIQTSNGCTIQKNTVRFNTGYGLNLSSTSAYRENVITNNTAGTVNSGYNMGNNFCNTNSTCP